jgi:hypothetical protein
MKYHNHIGISFYGSRQAISEIDSLLNTLKGRSANFENRACAKAILKNLDSI